MEEEKFKVQAVKKQEDFRIALMQMKGEAKIWYSALKPREGTPPEVMAIWERLSTIVKGDFVKLQYEVNDKGFNTILDIQKVLPAEQTSVAPARHKPRNPEEEMTKAEWDRKDHLKTLGGIANAASRAVQGTIDPVGLFPKMFKVIFDTYYEYLQLYDEKEEK